MFLGTLVDLQKLVENLDCLELGLGKILDLQVELVTGRKRNSGRRQYIKLTLRPRRSATRHQTPLGTQRKQDAHTRGLKISLKPHTYG